MRYMQEPIGLLDHRFPPYFNELFDSRHTAPAFTELLGPWHNEYVMYHDA